MITIIIVSVLLFISGFVMGFLYKIIFFRPKAEPMPYLPICQPPYIPFDMPYQESIEQLREDLRCVQLEISIHPLHKAEHINMAYGAYQEMHKEYKELKLKELALVEKINKINKDNGVYK